MKMKKLFRAFLLAAVMIMALSLPAFAGVEYGQVYDGTSRMQANTLQNMGEVVLPALSGEHDLDLRVDIVSDLQGYSLADYAEGLYNNYDYGDGYANGGLLFLLYLAPDSSGYELGGYQIYYGGSVYPDLASSVQSAMEGRINVTAWNSGEPLDRAAVNDALQVYADAVSDYFLTADGSAAASTTESAGVTDTAAAADTTEQTGEGTVPTTSARLDYVTDSAGLLSSEQRESLNEKARAISEEYGCGVYIVTVNDFQDYTSGDAYDCATGIFTDNDLGYGATKDGTLLLLSMADRDYALIAHGDLGNAAFTDYGKERMSDGFLSYFADNDWYGGFNEYLATSSQYLEMAANGEPYDTYGGDGAASKAGRTGVVLGVPTLVAGLVSRMQSLKMRSVRKRTNASAYAAPTGLIIHGQRDAYTHSTESRTRIAAPVNNRGSSGGGGGTTIHGGGFSGHSGKF